MADPAPELLIKEFLVEVGREYERDALRFHFSFKADQAESARKILALPRPQQIPVLLYAVAYQVEAIEGRTLISGIVNSLIRIVSQTASTGAAPAIASLELTGLIAAILRKDL